MLAQSSLAARLVSASGPFELVRDNADGLARFARGPQTAFDLLASATRAADRPFLRGTNGALSLHAALDRADRLRTLVSGHVTPGKVVGLAIDDPLDWSVAFLALLGLDVAVALLPQGLEEQAYAASLAECAFVLGPAGSMQGAGKPLELEFDGGRLGALPAPWALQEVAPTSPTQCVATSTALIAFTSGTTSRPKAVRVTHENLVAGLRTMQLGATLAALRRTAPAPRMTGGRAKTILLAPLSHVGGYGQVLGALMGGGELVFPRERDPASVAALIAEERATAIMGAPERLVWDLLRLHDQHDLTSLTTIGVLGVTLEPAAFAKLAAVLPGLKPGASYGMTETSGAVAVASDEDLLHRPGSSGLPAPNVDLEVRDDDGGVLEPGQAGWIWVRGAMITRAYIGRARLLEDGWFRTGDQGWLDSEGFLFLIDRASFPIPVAGRELASGMIENLARNLAGVAEAAAVPSTVRTGRGAVLFVAPVDAACAPSARQALETAWPGAGQAITVTEISSLPRTRSGKVDRPALEALLNLAAEPLRIPVSG